MASPMSQLLAAVPAAAESAPADFTPGAAASDPCHAPAPRRRDKPGTGNDGFPGLGDRLAALQRVSPPRAAVGGGPAAAAAPESRETGGNDRAGIEGSALPAPASADLERVERLLVELLQRVRVLEEGARMEAAQSPSAATRVRQPLTPRRLWP